MKKIMAILVLLVISVILFGCKPIEEAGVEPEEPVTQPGAPTEAYVEAEGMLSELQCVGENIQGRIKNVLNKEVGLDDIRVLFNGVVVDPATLRCDKSTLKPGESTFSESIQGIFPIKTANAVAVVMDSKTVKEVISC